MSAHRIIFYNQKGGVGKTTATVNLGSALAKLGYRVLLIDFDAQCNLTSSVSGDNRKPSIYSVITGQTPVANAVQDTIFDNLYLIPGSLDLAGLGIELVNEDGREFFLKNSIRDLDNDFDYILLDCPPSLGLETMNALCWADYVVIPLQCEYFAMEGLNMIMRTVTNVRKQLNPQLKTLGILFTMYSKRAVINKEVVEDISAFFKDLVFRTIIPRSVRMAEAPSHGMPIDYYDKSNCGTKAFAALAKEVVGRVE
ncbi:MAG: ParA family protein [Candidatus Ornithospirochaeta sp.]|nr:ParA family protein [Candidatus Ornithospirochaeta sp.]